ncbi:GmrSD restriction endonuclease domain-containing protein [Geofilum rubicundum]|uniref:GmrSD restriction endonucleases N-terminal domain-containing protein n=1 Tax=Geofilum rubicundum JCM 15548 TaxID=1236989 RepID=A0A0E9LV48_9BACT|nr:DUF262 domain-containing protein [Geofilum rubicundum]GAO29129.1 hypothetical protein JCM15548_11287 [Geofilum rubicundum JCM 15548]
MENRVYYGEYSLKHWIDLILKQNIILPDYQRFFVWNEKKVKTLIETLKNKQFVPPITIGAFKIGETNQNLILDGQQRLTSILLAHLGLYPDTRTYKSRIEIFASENDEEVEEEDKLLLDNILEWNFNKLTEKGKNKAAILDKVIDGNYKSIDLQINDDFLKTTFLGFSYLVPNISDEKEQQKYYSSVFRNINIQGEALLPQESRASLYFLDHDLVGFFSPDFFSRIVIKTISSDAKGDFVRYLSLLANFHKDGNANRVARGYKPKMEKFYEEYIYASINNLDSETYGKLTNIIPNKDYVEQLSMLHDLIEQLNIPKESPSIIDLDIYLFGLIYIVIFKQRKVDIDKKEELMEKLVEKISQYKNSYSHKRSPNNLGHLRARITDSVTIYNQYLSHES